MGGYILRRVLWMIPVLIGVTALGFFLSNLLPGDPARAVAGRLATPEQLAAVSERLGLDEPIPVQYGLYLGRLVRGDFGVSLSSKQAISAELRIFFPATLELVIAAMTIVLLVGVPAGVVAATRRSGWADRAVLAGSYVGVGMPVFFLALLFQLVFAGWLRWLPIGGRLGLETIAPAGPTGLYTVDALLAGELAVAADAVRHLILPAATLALAGVSEVARITRRSMLQALDEDFTRTARAKGLSEYRVVVGHALPNALLPTVTVLGLQVAFLLGGTVLVENIYSWGGLGTYAWTGIFRLDIPVIMGITLVSSATYLVVNLGVDLVYVWLDPRVRHE